MSEPTHATSTTPARRRPIRLVAVWLVLATLGSTVHLAAWTQENPASLTRVAAGLNDSLILPAHAAVAAVYWGGANRAVFLVISQNILGWGAWVLGLAVLVRLARRAAARRVATTTHPDDAVVDPGRRAFLSAGLVAIPAVAAPTASVYAAAVEPSDLRVRRLTVPIRDLPAAFHGLTLVQISDTHLGPRVPAEWIDQAIKSAIELKPDLFCLTGDYVGGDRTIIRQAVAQFEPLFRAAPTVAVLGNHDWWADGLAFQREFASFGVPCIDNDRVFLTPVRTISTAPVPGSLAIVGLGDLIGDVTDTARAFRDVGPTQPVLLLAHEPDTAELPETTGPDAPRIDLMLTGHTHGGQIRLPLLGAPFIPSEYGPKYAAGLVQGPRFPVHVSTGVGISLLPIRFGVPPEVNHITLTRA